MLIPIAREAFLPFLVVSFLCGLCFGAVYEVFRIRRVAARMPHGKTKKRRRRWLEPVLVACEDVLFSLFAAVTLILVSFKLYYGVPRWYAYGAALLGFLLWRMTLGALILACASRILALIDRFFAFLRRRLLLPCLNLLRRGGSAVKKKLTAQREERYTVRCERGILDAVRRTEADAKGTAP